MRIKRYLSVCALCCVYLGATIAHAQDEWVVGNGTLVDQAVNAIWDPVDGSLQIVAVNLDGMTTSTLSSASGAFSPEVAFSDGNIDGILESENPPTFPGINSPRKFFTLTPAPNPALEWNFSAGYTPSADMGYSFLRDTTWAGSILPAGSWSDAPGGGPYLHIPEPSSWALIAFAFLGLGRLRRKHA